MIRLAKCRPEGGRQVTREAAVQLPALSGVLWIQHYDPED
jgi:hypothetical protein